MYVVPSLSSSSSPLSSSSSAATAADHHNTSTCPVCLTVTAFFFCLFGFLTSSSTTGYIADGPQDKSVWQFYVLPHMRQSWETMTSVSAGHIIQTPTQPVGSGRPQRELNPGPPHQESRALPQSYRAPTVTAGKFLCINTHLDRHTIEINDSPHRWRSVGGCHALVQAIDEVMQVTVGFAHQPNSITLLNRIRETNIITNQFDHPPK